MLQDKIQAILESASVDYENYRRSFVMTCPNCNKHKKLWILKTTGQFVCWTCQESGFSGRPEYALAALTGRPVSEIKSELYINSVWQTGVYLNVKWEDWFDPDEDDIEIVESPLIPTVWSPEFVPIDSNHGMPGAEYLLKRGVDVATATRYQIQYHPKQQRVIFPVISNGSIYGWQARTIGPEKVYLDDGTSFKVVKALTSAGLKKNRVLMFADRLSGTDHAILTEGPMDALKADLCGGGNVCTMGKQVSEYQIKLLLNSGIKRLYLGLDPDAYAEARKILKDNWQKVDVYDLRPPKPYKDLGEMPMEAVKTLFDAAPKLEHWQTMVHFDYRYR